MRILIASDQHYLLPYAWRLRREGADVEVLVFKDRFEAAWAGMFEKALTGKDKSRDSLGVLEKMAADGDMIVATDSPRGMRVFSDGAIFGKLVPTKDPVGPLTVGAWFDGEKFVPNLNHLVVNEWGLWPNGMGPGALAGATMVRGTTLLHLHLGQLVEGLVERNFRGLVGVDATPDGDGWKLGRVEAGWPQIHSDAFLGAISSLSKLLSGEETSLEAKYVVVVPVTIPPWPIEAKGVKARELPVGGLEAADQRNIFFRDFRRGDDYEILTAGLDGFICVVRGHGNSLDLARGRALSIAAKIELPEKQTRLDIGLRAGLVLGSLEEAGFFSGPVEPGSAISTSFNLPLADEITEDSIELGSSTSDTKCSTGEIASSNPISPSLQPG